VQNLNFKTTDTLMLDRVEKIQTPKGKTVQQTSMVLEDAGTYKVGERTIAVNLLNELESDINSKESIGAKSTEYKLSAVKEPRKYNLELALAGAALVFLLFEMMFIKLRGDV